jgi:DNA-binding HxlR family transcriptional regulator
VYSENVRRDYEQTCGLARALDVVGERWTLLIIRDLLLGPKRFTDLLDGLPGIPPSLLSSRLKQMQSAGVVTKEVLPPPAASTVYRLTEAGGELEHAVLALGRWGVQFGRSPRPTDVSKPGSLPIALRALFQADAAAGVHDTYELRLPDGPVRLTVDDQRLRIELGAAERPRVVLTGKQRVVMTLLAGQLAPGDAARRGDVRIEGDRKALIRLVAMFSPQRKPQPASAST